MQSPLFEPKILDHVYQEIQKENQLSSQEYNLPLSIRTTLVKPSGTLSLLGEVSAGIHPTYAPHYIRRVRFASSDPLVPILKAAGHPVEHAVRFDGSKDVNTSVVSFFVESPPGVPTAKEFDTWKQLDTVLMTQKYWADQAVSVTVYYDRQDIPEIKEWLSKNLSNIKTISFLPHAEHGFAQAPLEEITQEEYAKHVNKLSRVDLSSLDPGDMESVECEGGSCPVK